MKKWSWIILAVIAGMTRPAGADLFHSPKLKSPAGKYEIIFASASAAGIPFTQIAQQIPPGQKLQYILLFYPAGGTEPVSGDWYTDATPPPTAEQLAASMLWSPGEEYVVVTHGQNAKAAGANRWLVSMSSAGAYGFEGENLVWVDKDRLVADLKTKKVRGGIELMNARTGHAELLISPVQGIGFSIAAVSAPRVTVKEFLNHWGDEHDRTTWDHFEPACFEIDLDTLKKRTVPCPPVK